MEDQTNAQPIVTAMVSIDYESYKAFQKDTLGYWWLTSSIMSLVAIASSFLSAYLITWLLADEFGLVDDRSKCFWITTLIISVWPAMTLLRIAKKLIDIRPSKLFQAPKAILETEKQYTFFENYLTLQMPHVYDMVEYAYYPEAQESKSAFYLKTPEGTYVQLPKKCFTEDQITALRDLFARKFEKKFKAIT